MNLLILGHRHSGKTELGQRIARRLGTTAHDSSQFMLERVIFPALKDKYSYETTQECYEDRNNHRDEWFNLIKAFNNPPDRLTREILSEGSIYVGMRSRDEFTGAHHHFDAIIWVNAEGRVTAEDKTSMELNEEDADYILDNRGSIENLESEIDKLFQWLKGVQ